MGGPVSERLRLRRDEVSSGFFATVGTPLLRGRLFSAEDAPDAPRVALINDAMAGRLWPGEDSVGRRFKLAAVDAEAPWFTVVGVVGEMHRQGPEREAIAQMFEPLAQNPSRLVTLLVRTSSDDPLTLSRSLETVVRAVDRRVPIYGVRTLEDGYGAFLAQRRFQTALMIGFSAVALLMAAIGIFALMQHSVAMRTREIAIRIAVGAEATEILRMVLREGMALSLWGLGLGLLGAIALAPIGSSLLFGVTASDPTTFVAVSLLLTGVAAAACYIPARRAMKVAPVAALRQSM
ncbi:MAG: FtsX-like permease family protein [Vicinamibacterales bacterium]